MNNYDIITAIMAVTVFAIFMIWSISSTRDELIKHTQENCSHKNKSTYVESTACGVETTTIRCLDCKKLLSKHNTEVR